MFWFSQNMLINFEKKIFFFQALFHQKEMSVRVNFICYFTALNVNDRVTFLLLACMKNERGRDPFVCFDHIIFKKCLANTSVVN